MTERLSYIIDDHMDLDAELAAGFSKLSIRRLPGGGIVVVGLQRPSGDGLRVLSKMHDLAERTELGVLRLRIGDREEKFDDAIELPRSFNSSVSGSRLVKRIGDREVESGLRLLDSDGVELVVVAGEMPGTLAIRAPFLKEPFFPEYPLDEYSSESLESEREESG